MANRLGFSNLAHIQVIESAANTLTFKKLETGIAVTEKIAWNLHRIEYYLTTVSAALFNATGDAVSLGLAASNSIVNVEDMSNPSLLDLLTIQRQDIGVAASGFFQDIPRVKDFAALPAGGLLIPPNPLFGFVVGNSLTGAMTVRLRLFYSPVELKVDEFWQLVEAYRVISS